MGHQLRHDEPGAWHHVMNRGIARRTMFERRRDIRYFLSRVARTVRDGQLEVHAYCILTTHYHMLVRSPIGELSTAMQRIQNSYVRWFNRTRRRDGPLIRSRFLSKRVRTLQYRTKLVRYIDDNPVQAGLKPHTLMYEHGSARHHVSTRAPKWLSRDWISGTIASGGPSRGPRLDYLATFGTPPSDGLRRLIELRCESHSTAGDDALTELYTSSAPRVQAWMQRKSLLADGTRPGLPVLDAARLGRVLDAAMEHFGPWRIDHGRAHLDGWRILHTGLLRELCALGFREIGIRTGCSRSQAWRDNELHRQFLISQDGYAQRAAELAQDALEP